MVSAELRDFAFRCGRAFGVELYGVDIIESGGVPYVVDVGVTPGYKGVPDAPRLVARYLYAAAIRTARGGQVASGGAALAAGGGSCRWARRSRPAPRRRRSA